MAAKRVRAYKSIQSLSAIGLFAIIGVLSSPSHVSAFPSLFNRASIFRRHNQHNQQQQQQQQQQLQLQQQQQDQPRQDQLVSLAANFKPMMSNPANPAELLRISGMHQQPIGAHQMQQPQFLSAAASFPVPHRNQPQLQIQPQPQPQPQAQQLQHTLDQMTPNSAIIYNDGDTTFMNPFDPSPQAAAYYKSSMVRPLASLNGANNQQQQQQQQQHQQQQQQPASQLVQEQSFDMSDNSNYFNDDQAHAGQTARRPSAHSVQAQASGHPHSEPTHTSEIVDKIEQHVEHQIEQGLKKSDHHEKEGSASGEPGEHEESSEAEEGGGGGGGGEEKEKVEKRHEEHKPHHHEHEHHHHEHHEHHHHDHVHMPPEAFEVHHKKGGKSYQYFHQGHAHP